MTALWRAITVLLQAAAFFLLGLELPESLRLPPETARRCGGPFRYRRGPHRGAHGGGLGGFGPRLTGLDAPHRWRAATLVAGPGHAARCRRWRPLAALVTADGLPLPPATWWCRPPCWRSRVTLVLSTTLTPVARMLKIQSPDTSAVESRLRLAHGTGGSGDPDAARLREADQRNEPFPTAGHRRCGTATVHRVRGRPGGGSVTRQDQERLRAFAGRCSRPSNTNCIGCVPRRAALTRRCGRCLRKSTGVWRRCEHQVTRAACPRSIACRLNLPAQSVAKAAAASRWRST